MVIILGRRDWAFSERDKIVLERESIRTLCDNMRKERDRAVSELAEALRESDAIKKQRNELMKEVKMLKEALEVHMEKEAQFNHFRGLEHNNSHDSAIDSDMQVRSFISFYSVKTEEKLNKPDAECLQELKYIFLE